MIILVNLELILVGVAIISVCVAVYTDMRWRIIPNKLNFPLIVFGVAFYIFLGIQSWDLLTAASGAIGAAISFIIGYIMWRTGGWAGGDVKLFTALGALLYGYRMPVGNPIYPVPLTILFNSIIFVSPLIFAYALVRRMQGREVLYERVKITELKEGMIPAETIYKKDGKIVRHASRLGVRTRGDKIYTNPRRAAGLTRHQIGSLKILVRDGKLENIIKVKRGLPFAPALGAGVLIAVLYGDLYWQFLLSVFGK